MARVRTDNVFGTTTDNPLTNVATTMNSAGLANLAAVSSKEAIITLDPNRLTGAPEIVVVTAHTGAATSATIQRGQFGTTARQHAQGTEWVHGPIAGNATTYATPADDQGDYVPMDAWESYTPTLTNLTIGNGTLTGRFVRHGRKITATVRVVFGSSTSIGGNVSIGIPVTAANLTAAYIIPVFLLDNGTRIFVGVGRIVANTAVVDLYHSESGNSGIVNATNPYTFTTSDEISLTATYEAAS